MSNYGVDTMVYSPAAPWQGIGTEVKEAMTAEEAIVKAGLDWQVAMKPVYILGKKGYHKVPGRFACTRRDTGDVFGVFGKGYEPIQNRDKFGPFTDGLVANGEAIIHSAGALNGGALTWVYMQLPGELKVSDTDVLTRGILLTDSYDGSRALGIRFMNVRQICCNTMQGIIGGRGAQFRGKHTINLVNRVNEARQVMGLEEAYSQMLMRGIEKVAQEAMDKAQLNQFLEKLFGVEEDADALTTRVQNQMDKVGDLFYHGLGNNGETRWDALNAVTEYVDHHRDVRVAGGSNKDPMAVSSARLNGAWFGAGADIKQRAWDLLVPAN